MVESTARLVRRRAREELTSRIVGEARRQLATEGAAGLSRAPSPASSAW